MHGAIDHEHTNKLIRSHAFSEKDLRCAPRRGTGFRSKLLKDNGGYWRSRSYLMCDGCGIRSSDRGSCAVGRADELEAVDLLIDTIFSYGEIGCAKTAEELAVLTANSCIHHNSYGFGLKPLRSVLSNYFVRTQQQQTANGECHRGATLAGRVQAVTGCESNTPEA